MEQLLEVLTVRRADGSEFSLEKFPLARALATSETVRAEEIVMSGAGWPEDHRPDQCHSHPLGAG